MFKMPSERLAVRHSLLLMHPDLLTLELDSVALWFKDLTMVKHADKQL